MDFSGHVETIDATNQLNFIFPLYVPNAGRKERNSLTAGILQDGVCLTADIEYLAFSKLFIFSLPPFFCRCGINTQK